MNKIKTIAVLASIVGATYFAFQVYMAGHDIAIEERFPDIDPVLARTVHREMARDALHGKLKHANTDEELDAEFLLRVRIHSNK